MRSASRGLGAKRVNGLRARGHIAETRKGAEERRGSFAEVRAAQREARARRIGVPGKSVLSVRVERESAKDLNRGRRSPFGRAAKVDVKGLDLGHRSHSGRVEKAEVKDLRHVQRRHFVLGVKGSEKDLHRDLRNRIVLVVRVNAKDLHHGHRSRFGDAKRAAQGLARSGRSAEENEMIELRVALKEGRRRSGLASRGSQRRSLAAGKSSAASESSVGNASQVGSLHLGASRNLDREQGM